MRCRSRRLKTGPVRTTPESLSEGFRVSEEKTPDPEP